MAKKNQKKDKKSSEAASNTSDKVSVRAEAKSSEAKSTEAKVSTSQIIQDAAEVLGEAEVVLTDAEGNRYCRSADCDQLSSVDGYCRYHYLLFWKRIQNRKKILADGKLERYIDELTARYTDKFIELLRKDLRTEKDFMSAVQELEIDDSGSGQDEDEAKSYIEEIRGISDDSGSRADDEY